MGDEPESDEESRPTDEPVDDVETGRDGRTDDDSAPDVDDAAPSEEPPARESADESEPETDPATACDPGTPPEPESFDAGVDPTVHEETTDEATESGSSGSNMDEESDTSRHDDEDDLLAADDEIDDDFVYGGSDVDADGDDANSNEADGDDVDSDTVDSDSVNDYADTDGPFDYKVIDGDDSDRDESPELDPADEVALATEEELDDLPEYEAEAVETTDGGTTATGDAGYNYEDEYAYDDDGDWLGDGPESDQEMPLADHIEEMVQRLAVVLFVGLGVSLAVFALGDTVHIINYLWGHLIPNPATNRPRVYAPLNILLTELKVAGLAGLVIGLPVFVYETYLFMRPGLYPKERRYYLAAVPTSLVLAVFGVLFAHFLILPYIFGYFTKYTTNAATIAFGLRATFNLIVIMMGYMAIVFQIPLFIMLAIMMGVVSREWMEEKRLLFWGGFVGLSFTFVAVDPTGMAPIIIGVTMILLFEITLALLRWTGN